MIFMEAARDSSALTGAYYVSHQPEDKETSDTGYYRLLMRSPVGREQEVEAELETIGSQLPRGFDA